MDQPLSAWKSTLATANEREPARRRAVRGLASGALRTSGLLVLATLAILVLLPAMIAAQPTFLG